MTRHSSAQTRVAMVTMHTSPIAQAGTGDAGGMNIAVLAIATELGRRGIEVDLLTRADGSAQVIEVAENVTLRALEAGERGPLPKERLGEVADEFGEAVARLTGRQSPSYDVIHAHYWLSGLATLPVALELGLPFVQSFHTVAAMKNATLAPGQKPEPDRRVFTERFLAHQANAIIAGSAAEVTALIDDVNAPAERIWVVPPGVDVELFNPSRADAAGRSIRTQLRIPPDRPIVAVVGRVQPLKDQELAIRAMAELRALTEAHPVLVIAGEATPGEDGYAAFLRTLADELGIAADVRFAGALSRDRLADLLAAATVTLVPSRSETFGIVALESAASGTPVVAFHGGGLIESVAPDISGLLVDSREPRAWAQNIAGLIGDQQRLTTLGGSARNYAEGFTWASTAAGMLGVYASLAT